MTSINELNLSGTEIEHDTSEVMEHFKTSVKKTRQEMSEHSYLLDTILVISVVLMIGNLIILQLAWINAYVNNGPKLYAYFMQYILAIGLVMMREMDMDNFYISFTRISIVTSQTVWLYYVW